MLSEKRGLLITTHFWQLPRGNVAFCSNKITPQLTYWMLNIDSYYECCQTVCSSEDPYWQVIRNSISKCQVRNQRAAGLFRDEIYRFHKMWNRSSTCDDGNGHGRMRLSLARCISQKRSITQKCWPLKISFKGWDVHDKDNGSCRPTNDLFRAKSQTLNVHMAKDTYLACRHRRSHCWS